MPTELTRAEHLDALREAMLAFVRYGERAGLDAPVPTCPGWTVRHLVAHQGMVHRWVSENLRGGRPDPDSYEREGMRIADPWEWLSDGAIDLAGAITNAPDEVRTVVFLNDAPPPRRFWARRQCHETTIHAVDALSAFLGRWPTGAETWISPAVALDGIDELLAGFLTRHKSRLRADEPLRVVVAAQGAPYGWSVDLSAAPPVTSRWTDEPDGDVRLAGDPVALYLALWNRSDEIVPEDDDVWTLWREGSAVRWG